MDPEGRHSGNHSLADGCGDVRLGIADLLQQHERAIDRFYACAYPVKPPKLRKVAMLLNFGASNVYYGAIYSYQNDFMGYLGLEDMGVFTACGALSASQLDKIGRFGRSL